MADKQFRIAKEIESLLPPLTDEEFAGLDSAMQVDGYCDPLVVADIMGDLVLLDGHNRYKICRKRHLQFQIRVIKIPSMELAKQWVIDNQLSRRNLTDERRAYYRGKEYLNVKQPKPNEVPPKGQFEPSGNTAEKLASKHDVSPSTIKRDAEYAAAVDAIGSVNGKAEKEKILSGEDDRTRAEVVADAPILCSRCQRVQKPVVGCPACGRAQAEAAAKKSKKKKPKQQAKKYSGDIPKDVQNALADTWHLDCARILSRIAVECKKAFSWSSYLDASVLDHLKNAEECFLTAAPRKVCPDCKGKKIVDKKACITCRQGGYLASQANETATV